MLDPALPSPTTETPAPGESDLIRRAASDPDAFGHLYRLHYRAIVEHLYRRTADRHTAEDLACDTFTAAYQSIARFRDRGIPFRCWLLKIATNRANAWAKRRSRVSLVPQAQLVEAGADSGPAPDRALTLDEAHAALMSLSPAHQAILTLFHVEGLTLEQVGLVLELRPGTVKSRLARARARLEQELRRRGCHE